MRSPRGRAGGGGRRVVAVTACLSITLAAALAPGEAAPDAGEAEGAAARELPRGGTSILPEYRPVALYGAPQAASLGELGKGSPRRATRVLRKQARPYKRLSQKRVYPTFELIATIALASPGADGKYRARQPKKVVRRYLREVQRRDFLLVLDIQPGQSTFIEEVKALRRWLRNRNVSIALDPEWNMGPDGVPGERIGDVDASMINKVSRYMSRLTRRHDLPDKLLVIHRFTKEMVKGQKRIKRRRGIDIVLNADGFGTPAAKRSKYEQLAPGGNRLHPGFKLFYEEDTRGGSKLMSPKQVMRLRPRPRFVVYE